MQHSEGIAKLAAAFPLLLGHVWSAAPGASRYLVAEDGTVLSLVREPRVLKPIMCGKYRAVQLAHDDGMLRKRYLHRLVLEAWHGPAPEGEEARHLDGDRTRNTVGNLAWGTRLENHADKKRHGTTAKGAKNPQAKLDRLSVEQMRTMYAAGGWTYKRLAFEFGVSTMTALRAVKGESWN